MTKNKLKAAKFKQPSKNDASIKHQKWVWQQSTKNNLQQTFNNFDYFQQFYAAYENIYFANIDHSEQITKSIAKSDIRVVFILSLLSLLNVSDAARIEVMNLDSTDICPLDNTTSVIFPSLYDNADSQQVAVHTAFFKPSITNTQIGATVISREYIENLFFQQLSAQQLSLRNKIVRTFLEIRKESASTRKYIDRVLLSKNFSIKIKSQKELSKDVISNFADGQFSGSYKADEHQISFEENIHEEDLRLMIRHEFWHANMRLTNMCLEDGDEGSHQDSFPFNNFKSYIKFAEVIEKDELRIHAFKKWLDSENSKKSLDEKYKKILNENEFKSIKKSLADYPSIIEITEPKGYFKNIYVGGMLKRKGRSGSNPCKILKIKEESNGATTLTLLQDKYETFVENYYQLISGIKEKYGYDIKKEGKDRIHGLMEFDADLEAYFNSTVKDNVFINRAQYHRRREHRAFSSGNECTTYLFTTK